MQATNPVVRKRALVVDDSKSARVVLSRMLEQYDIDVEMAESAEAAIEYLKHDRPDAIFMDHLMPGMDGLQAVQLIKSNPQTATIPIMMYTSQAGELYVGQARALGAMGVLPKQVRPVDVSKVLYELHLLPDRRTAESALVPVEVEDGTPIERTPAVAPAAPIAAAVADEWARRLEAAVKQQSVDLRRFVVASLDSLAARITADLRPATPAPPVPPALETPASPAGSRPALPWAFAALALLGAAGALFAWNSSHEDLARARAQLAAASARESDLARERDQLAGAVKDLTAALASMSAPAVNTNVSMPGVTGLPRFESVPYGELPFDRQRVEVLREVLAKLEAQGFHGTLKVSSSAGLFCLTGNASDGFVLANPSLPAAKCDLVGNPFDDALGGQPRQSLAFANLVAAARQRGGLNVVLESNGSSHPSSAYPARSDTLSAGDWNRAALANNRVEFLPEPAVRGESTAHAGEPGRTGEPAAHGAESTARGEERKAAE